jgi:hypothetical protein
LAEVKRSLRQYANPVTVQAYSSLKREGIDALALVLRGWLQVDQPYKTVSGDR